MAAISKPEERDERALMVRDVLATLGLEGLSPSADVQLLLDEFVEGSRSLEEVGAAIERKYSTAGTLARR